MDRTDEWVVSAGEPWKLPARDINKLGSVGEQLHDAMEYATYQSLRLLTGQFTRI